MFMHQYHTNFKNQKTDKNYGLYFEDCIDYFHKIFIRDGYKDGGLFEYVENTIYEKDQGTVTNDKLKEFLPELSNIINHVEKHINKNIEPYPQISIQRFKNLNTGKLLIFPKKKVLYEEKECYVFTTLDYLNWLKLLRELVEECIAKNGDFWVQFD